MKKLISLGRTLSFLMMLPLIMISCSKTGTIDPKPNPNPGGGNHNPPAAPLTLGLKADTALNGGSAKVYVTTDGQTVTTGSQTVTGGFITFYNLKNDTTVYFSATNTNEYGTSTAKTNSITIKVYSQKTTQLQSYTPMHVTFYKSCVDGGQSLNPIPWVINGPINPDFWLKFFANGGGQSQTVAGGPIYTYPAGQAWNWTDASEESINFGAGDIWKVTLKSNGFERSQIKGGYYTLQIYEQ